MKLAWSRFGGLLFGSIDCEFGRGDLNTLVLAIILQGMTVAKLSRPLRTTPIKLTTTTNINPVTKLSITCCILLQLNCGG